MKWTKNPFPSSRRGICGDSTNCGHLPLYILQALQLLTSVIVLGIILYFITQLRGSHMTIPWSFIIHLLVASISTASVILLTLCAGAGRPPACILILNGVLVALWALSLGLLINIAKSTILSQCTSAIWNNSTGIMVCHLYKTLYLFIIIALASTLLALIYVSHARHSSTETYTKTANPSNPANPTYPLPLFHGAIDADEASESPPPSAPLSASSSQTSFCSPLPPDDRSLSFPASPSPRGWI